MEATLTTQKKEADPSDLEMSHAHCVKCMSRRCMLRPEVGVCCELVGCPLVCGAVYHACKADEHRLLCLLERVPCINSDFGCPFTMARNKVSEHLEVCPASVVCCTMEWNRWPVSYADRVSYENLSKDVDEVEQLDMALALQDQRMLLESLKVATMMSRNTELQPSLGDKEPTVLSLAKEKIANGINSLDEESYSKLYQATAETSRSLVAALGILSSASKDMDLINGSITEGNTGRNGEVHSNPKVEALYVENIEMKDENDCELGAVGGVDYGAAAEGTSDRKAWMEQDAFFDIYEAVEEKTVEDIIMKDQEPVCNGHNGGAQNLGDVEKMDLEAAAMQHSISTEFQDMVQPEEGPEMLNHSVDIEAQESSGAQPPPLPLPIPLPDEDDDDALQYSPVEFEERWFERKLQNLQVLRGMGVFAFNGRRALFTDPYQFRAKMEDKAVDTSDLELADDPMGLHGIDLITAALLFCLGDSPGGRGISDSRFVDGYRVDFGTQTFSFPSAILATNTMVGDIASASACDHANPQLTNPSPFHTLRLDLVLECVARYQTKQRSMFTFVCGQLFRRDEFSSHFKNVHADIHAGLNGWMERRCPLAYYGCTYSQRRFCPSTQGSKIIHDRHLRSFGVQPSTPLSGEPTSVDERVPELLCDRLSGLPFEVLQHIATFLDGFSLCQLSQVSHTMRDLCASLLQARGMVVLLWEKRSLGPAGPPTWQIKHKVWRFSTAFGTVREWKFANIASMADHLKECRFNTVERREEAVPLPCMCFTRELTKGGRSLRSVLKPVL